MNQAISSRWGTLGAKILGSICLMVLGFLALFLGIMGEPHPEASLGSLIFVLLAKIFFFLLGFVLLMSNVVIWRPEILNEADKNIVNDSE